MKELLQIVTKTFLRISLDFLTVVFFLFAIITALTSSIFAGFLILICAILVLPETYPYIKRKIKYEITSVHVAVSVISLIAFSFGIIHFTLENRKKEEAFTTLRTTLMQDMGVASEQNDIQNALNKASEHLEEADDEFKKLYDLTTRRLEKVRIDNENRKITERKSAFDNQKDKILSSINEKISAKDYVGAKQIIAEYEVIQDADIKKYKDQINATEAAENQKIEEQAAEKRRANAQEQAKAELKARLAWDIESEKAFTKKEKELLKAGALKVLQDNPNCQSIFTGYRSGQKKGSYYVSCEAANGGMPFNVWFSPSDVMQDKNITVPKAYEENASRKLCYDAIMADTIHPSTLDIHSIMGYSTNVGNNGNREIIQTFSTKNSFGVELQHKARCLIMPDGKVELNISEQR